MGLDSAGVPFKQRSLDGCGWGGGAAPVSGAQEEVEAALQFMRQQQQQQQQLAHPEGAEPHAIQMASPPLAQLTPSSLEPTPGGGGSFWQKRGMNTSPVSVLMIPALNISVETTADEMDCDDDEVRGAVTKQ